MTLALTQISSFPTHKKHSCSSCFAFHANFNKILKLGKKAQIKTNMLLMDHCLLCVPIDVNEPFGYIPSKKSSAQVGVRVNSVLTRDGCIKCCISLFKEIILQHLDAFQTEIKGSLTKL